MLPVIVYLAWSTNSKSCACQIKSLVYRTRTSFSASWMVLLSTVILNVFFGIQCISWSILSVLCCSLRVAYIFIACDRRKSRKKIYTNPNMRWRLVYVLKTDIYPPCIVREKIAACVETTALLKTALNAVIAWRLPQIVCYTCQSPENKGEWTCSVV